MRRRQTLTSPEAAARADRANIGWLFPRPTFLCSADSSSPLLGGLGTELYAGHFVIYTATAENGGPSDAQNVNVSETLAGPTDTPNPVTGITSCVVASLGIPTAPANFHHGLHERKSPFGWNPRTR